MSDMEIGLIVGNMVAQLEHEGKISFTEYMDYDGELLEIAKQLWKEFGEKKNLGYGYFSHFVSERLVEMQEERSGNE